jgi:hypothetical protein
VHTFVCLSIRFLHVLPVFFGIHFGTLKLHALQKTILEMRALHLKSSGDVKFQHVKRQCVSYIKTQCNSLVTLVYFESMTSSCFG